MKGRTYFLLCHRGWRDVSIRRTKPSRDANLLSQSFSGIAHELVKKLIVVIALGDKRLSALY